VTDLTHVVDEERAAIVAADLPALTLTRFGRHDRPHGKRETSTWLDVFAEIDRRVVQPHDEAGWSFATFEGDHRKKEHVEAVFALAFDLEPKSKDLIVDDDGLGDPHKAVDAFAGFAGIVHSTRSSRPRAARSRVILPADRSMTGEEYAALWPLVATLATRAGLRVDPAAKDPSRFWYAPSLPKEGEPVVVRLAGTPHRVDTWLAEAKRREATETTVPRGDVDGSRYARAAVEGAVGRLMMADDGTRNDTLAREAYGVAQALAGAGLDPLSARATLRAAIAGWDPTYLRKHEETLDRQLAEGAKRPRVLTPRERDTRAVTSSPTPASASASVEPPTVRIEADLSATVTAALEALATDPDLYQRGGSLMRIVHDVQPADRERKLFSPGTPRLRAVEAPVLRLHLARVARWVKFDSRSKTWRDSRPDQDVVSAIHALGEWPSVRPIVGVIETPIMRLDGAIVDVPGYDKATGFVYEPSDDFGRIPNAPTRDDARKAYAELAEPFGEFPWASESARAAAVCTVLTLLARPAIDGPVPACIFDKNTPGTGGSLCTDVAAQIACGRLPGRITWPHNPEELSKVLDTVAFRSAAIACFDNIATPFGGSSLDKYLTATHVEARVLGKSESTFVPWRTLIMGSGNNVAFPGDTIRRVLRARMETSLERPQDRADFRIRDLRAWVTSNRVRLVRAGLIVLRAYQAAGRPEQLKPWGGFEAWTSLVGSAVAWASGTSPLEARVDVGENVDPTAMAHSALLASLPRLAPEGATIRTLVGLLYPKGRAPTDGPPDGFDDLREALETLVPPKLPGASPDVARLGWKLRSLCKVVRGGHLLVNKKNRSDVAVWRVESVQGMGGIAGDGSNPRVENGREKTNTGPVLGGIPVDAPHPRAPEVTSW
jgi:hypothetical protein